MAQIDVASLPCQHVNSEKWQVMISRAMLGWQEQVLSWMSAHSTLTPRQNATWSAELRLCQHGICRLCDWAGPE